MNVNTILKNPYWYWVYHSLNLVAKSVEVIALSVERILLSFKGSMFRTASIPDLKYCFTQKLLVVMLFNLQTLLIFYKLVFLTGFCCLHVCIIFSLFSFCCYWNSSAEILDIIYGKQGWCRFFFCCRWLFFSCGRKSQTYMTCHGKLDP